MYAWIWRKLPFGLWGKLTGSLVLALTAGALLWYVVFPWATPLLPFDDVQVGTGTEQQGPVPGGGADLGPDEIPYDLHTNNPEPSAS
ncbi:hypothetical protein [Couchioplanes caeruleus]|uniref:Uncharacterized protein n=2 Tax=Couchioplanes caeruleus TaxID=56438 RepID=A0A1K0FQE5_9ACTN|nr:hypothetical protein [Couchioplanes caeruleus]OJF14928.1 hypothetical protein BG844_07420 [Couchioplanes caeruleus subsp. caeruleus]ROP31060.1 hypothetical protein EDD30_3947 [Couchioplanes caeruleus]